MNRPPALSSSLAAERAVEASWWWLLALFVLLGLWGSIRYSGPTVSRRETAGVSGVRAIETLDMLLGDEQLSHPAGSKENQYVRVRLLHALNELNAQTWVLGLADNDGSRKDMANIIARIDGPPRARPLILVTHYDSSPLGPGAGDAGQCVAAILETLHVLKSQPSQYELWCLFTDGEERGLWGASDLVARKDLPWGSELPLVINFDARGDQGAALLYETHAHNLRAMQVAASALEVPRVSTSLMVNVYQRLPNGTDFTPFRKAGWAGWNFAVIDGAERYHTADDTIENLSLRSIQHFASHAINFIRKLDSLTADELRSIDDSEPGVFFDVLGQFLIVYPASWNWWQLGFVFSCWIVSWFIARPRLRLARCCLVVALIAIALLFSALAGWAIVWSFKAADLLPRRYVNYGDLICLLYPAAAAWFVMTLGRGLSPRCTRQEAAAGIVLVLMILGGSASKNFPGGAYLLLLPGCVLAALLLIDARFKLSSTFDRWFAVIACALPALLGAPTYVLLAQAMGPRYGSLVTVGVALMLLPTLLAWTPASRRLVT